MAATMQRTIMTRGKIWVLHSQHLSKEYAEAQASEVKRRWGRKTMIRQYRKTPLSDVRWAVYTA